TVAREMKHEADHGFAELRWQLVVALVGAIALVRVMATYRVFNQTMDEPFHIGCGMEWLQKGTYTLEPLHPPLARVAAAVGPFLEGLRLPQVAVIQGWSYDIYSAGNNILYARGRYRLNLGLSRLGILPFFPLAALVVFYWARNLFGDWPAVVAVLTFTTLPPILAFAGCACS